MENEKQADNFKIAISSTIKALAKKQDLNILFSDSPVKESNIINLPKINLFSIDEYQTIRAIADSEALKIKYSNYEISKKFDTVLYQFLETGTSDITFMGREPIPPLIFPLQSL